MVEPVVFFDKPQKFLLVVIPNPKLLVSFSSVAVVEKLCDVPVFNFNVSGENTFAEITFSYQLVIICRQILFHSVFVGKMVLIID